MVNPKELASLDGTEKKVLRFLATILENGRSTLEATELSDFLGGLEAEHRLVSIVARIESLGFLSECVPPTAPALKKAATRDNPETHSLIMHQQAQYVGWKISGSVLDTDSPMASALDDAASQPVVEAPTKPKGGWMGDVELAETLGVHSSRIPAFRAKLKRMRDKVELSIDDWQEIENRKRNEPQFLYLANAPAIVAMAKRYSLPK